MSKPRKLKEQLGTLNVTRDRRTRKDPNGFFLEDVKAPNWLSEDGKAVFEHTFAQLNGLELLRPEDLFHLAIYAQCTGEWIAITRQLNALPMEQRFLVLGAKGNEVKNPLLTLQKAYAVQSMEYGKLFSITPGARAKLNLSYRETGYNSTDNEDQFSDI